MVLTKKFSEFVEVPSPTSLDETVGLAEGQNARFPFGVFPPPSPFMEWNLANNTTEQMVGQLGFITNNVGLITFTLPLLCNMGETIAVSGWSAGGWIIEFNVGQNVIVGSAVATPSFGSVASTNRYDQIELLCVETNLTFVARFIQGTLTVI